MEYVENEKIQAKQNLSRLREYLNDIESLLNDKEAFVGNDLINAVVNCTWEFAKNLVKINTYQKINHIHRQNTFII